LQLAYLDRLPCSAPACPLRPIFQNGPTQDSDLSDRQLHKPAGDFLEEAEWDTFDSPVASVWKGIYPNHICLMEENYQIYMYGAISDLGANFL
jgi:hypothetical protein